MSKAILVVSFGTTLSAAKDNNITAVEISVAARFPNYRVYHAWTSSVVLSRLAENERVPEVTDALLQMHADEITELAVLPTHLLYGEEYDKLRALLLENAGLFESVKIAPPLLSDIGAMQTVLAAVTAETPANKDEALVLVGHGTRHFCNTVYAAMDYLAKSQGLSHVFIGTIEAFPDLDTVISAVKSAGFCKAALVPLMLVAGDHAVNDIASDAPESWQSRFIASGVACRAIIKGLGECEAVRQLYAEHVRQLLL